MVQHGVDGIWIDAHTPDADNFYLLLFDKITATELCATIPLLSCTCCRVTVPRTAAGRET